MRSRQTTIVQFAERHRLRVKRDGCGDAVVLGKFGHLYEHNTDVIGVSLEDVRSGPSRARCLLGRRRMAVDAGFRLHQAGEAESILLFEVGDTAQEVLAIKLVGAKQRRTASPAQLKVLRRAREAFKSEQTLAQRPAQEPGTHECCARQWDPVP